MTILSGQQEPQKALFDNEKITKNIGATGSGSRLTPPQVSVNYMNFRIFGDDSDDAPDRLHITMKGTVTEGSETESFDLQTTVTQRI